jgi:hypothetical protein
MRKSFSISALIILVLSLPFYAPANADQLHNFTLPDDGPRYETPGKGPDGSLFTDGIAALRQERDQDAEQMFDTLVKNFPMSHWSRRLEHFLRISLRKEALIINDVRPSKPIER